MNSTHRHHQQPVSAIVSRCRYRLFEDRIHFVGARDAYDPFEAYYQGETPHLEFVALAHDPQADKVLEFVNKWGLPGPDIPSLEALATSVDEIVADARRMYFLASLLALVRNPTKRQFQQLRGIISNRPPAIQKVLFWRYSLNADPKRKRYSLNADPRVVLTKIPDNQVLILGRLYCQRILGDAIKTVRPEVIMVDRENPDIEDWAAVSFVTEDLRTSLYLMFYLDLTRNNPMRKCERPNCSRIFRFSRKDQLYCSSHCAHAEAARAWRARNPKDEHSGDGRKHAIRGSKK